MHNNEQYFILYNKPLKNIQQYAHLVYQLHKVYKTRMVQRRNTKFCDLGIILRVSKDSGNTPLTNKKTHKYLLLSTRGYLPHLMIFSINFVN